MQEGASAMMAILKHMLAGLAVAIFATAALAQSEYRVRSGDALVIEVLEDASLNRSVVVLPDGRFSFPFAGSLKASGRTVGQIEASLTSAIASNFAATPNVFVAVQPKERPRSSGVVAKPDTIKVYFLGEVNGPGAKDVEPGTTFLQAMAQAGGLGKFAATKRIQLRRTERSGKQKIWTFNYKAISQGAQLNSDPRLKDGDVILVPERRLFE